MKHQSVSVGLINPKSPTNVGGVLRACGCYGVSSVYFSGQRYARAKKYATDTKNNAAKIPITEVANLQQAIPDGASVVAVELVEGATPLPHFIHPDNAFYLFGPEDGSIDNETLTWCNHVVYIPTTGCMNLAATVNVLLYDRLAKDKNTQYGDEVILQNRDTNNRSKHTT